MKNGGLEEAQAGIKTARRNINKLRYVHDTTLIAESKEKLFDETQETQETLDESERKE